MPSSLLINRFDPAAALFDNLGCIVVAYPSGNQGNDSVIGIVADMGIYGIGHFAHSENVINSRDIDIDVGDIDTESGIQVVTDKIMGYRVA